MDISEIIQTNFIRGINDYYILILYNLNKNDFINYLKKYGDGYFYGLSESFYNKVFRGMNNEIMFSMNIRNLFKDDLTLLSLFLSCFFYPKSKLEEYCEFVEKELEEEKDILSFNQYKDAYIIELKNLIDNYELKKET